MKVPRNYIFTISVRFTNGKNACSFLHTYGDSIGSNCVATISEPCVFRCVASATHFFILKGNCHEKKAAFGSLHSSVARSLLYADSL